MSLRAHSLQLLGLAAVVSCTTTVTKDDTDDTDTGNAGVEDTGGPQDTGGPEDSADTDETDTPQDTADSGDTADSDVPIPTADDLAVEDLRITEIMAAPGACADSDGEYIEVLYAGTGTANLIGLELSDDGGAAFQRTTDLLVQNGDRILFARDAGGLQGCYGFAGAVTTGLALSNGGDTLTLSSTGRTTPFETVDFSTGAWGGAVGSVLTGTAFERDDLDPDRWCYADTTIVPSADLGSPTQPNGSCPEDTDTDTPDTGDTSDTDPPVVAPALILSELADPVDPSSGDARFLEVTNVDSVPVDLGSWSVVGYANGNTSPSADITLPAETLAPGSSWVVAYQETAFIAAFGTIPNITYNGGVSALNGDDTWTLVYGGSVVDVYGEIGVDGSGEPWDHEDQIAIRRAGVTTGRTTWLASEWDLVADDSAATPGTHGSTPDTDTDAPDTDSDTGSIDTATPDTDSDTGSIDTDPVDTDSGVVDTDAGRITLFLEDFEDITATDADYTASVSASGGNDNHFIRTDGITPVTTVPTGFSGHFWAAEDIDDAAVGNGDPVGTLTTRAIDVSGYDALEVSWALAARRAHWDEAGDRVEIEISADGTRWTSLWSAHALEGGTAFNKDLAPDLDGDDLGDGAPISPSATMFSASTATPSSGTLFLRVVFSADAADEEAGLDDLRVTGIPGPTDTDPGPMDSDTDGALTPLTVAELFPGELVISEILVDPSSSGSTSPCGPDAEFVEIENRSGLPIQIGGLGVSVNTATTSRLTNTLLDPDSVLTVAASVNSFEACFGTDVLLAGGTIDGSLINGGGTLYLLDPANRTLDEVSWTSTVPSEASSWSLDADDAWCDSPTLDPSGTFATPGTLNPTCPVP